MDAKYDRNDPKYNAPPRKASGQESCPGIFLAANYGELHPTIKPWGKEILLCQNNAYTFKRIEIKKGYETSLQYHNKKNETIFFLSGRARVVYGDSEGNLACSDLEPGAVFETHAPAIHRVVALTDISYVEASTPDPGGEDVVRLRDGHKRPDGRIEGEYR